MQEIEIKRKFKHIDLLFIDSINDVKFIEPSADILEISYEDGEIYMDFNRKRICRSQLHDKKSLEFKMKGMDFFVNTIILIASDDIFVIGELIKNNSSFFTRFHGNYNKPIFVIK